MKTISLKSYAKLNVGLQILNKRSDSFHNIHTLFQEIDLFDTIFLEKKKTGCGFSTNVNWLKNNDSNLCVRAWKRMSEIFEVGGINIFLNKKIPRESGLGGGSSNAATVLKGLRKLYDLNIADKQLENLSSKLGADVPFFIKGGLQSGDGIGDKLIRLNGRIPGKILLVIPRKKISTSWAYNNYKKFLDRSKERVNFASFLKRDPVPYELFENDFETIVVPAYPEIGNIKEMLLNHGVRFASLSGTGSTVYGIFDNEADAISVESSFPTSYKTFIVQPRLDSM